MPILSRNLDQKSIETVFLIAICRLNGDKWLSKTLFLSTVDCRECFQLPPIRCGYISEEHSGSLIKMLDLNPMVTGSRITGGTLMCP